MSLNQTYMSASSLTPSIISTPAGGRSFSPTGTPLNSPTHTPPGTPPNEKADSAAGGGLVASFFSSLKAALYGEQQKEIQIKRRKSMRKHTKFGILEKVEEVGVENLMRDSPAPSDISSSREGSLSRSSSEFSVKMKKSKTEARMPHALSDFDLRFMHADDTDELEEIRPGTLTRNKASGDYVQDPTIGQLNAPSFSMFGRPSLHPGELGRVPSPAFDADAAPASNALGGGAFVGGRGPGRAVSAPGEKRPQLLGLMGIPGQPGTGALLVPPPEKGAPASLRPDLGSVPLTKSPVDDPSGGPGAGFIGSLTTMFFGRKGGLL